MNFAEIWRILIDGRGRDARARFKKSALFDGLMSLQDETMLHAKRVIYGKRRLDEEDLKKKTVGLKSTRVFGHEACRMQSCCLQNE